MRSITYTKPRPLALIARVPGHCLRLVSGQSGGRQHSLRSSRRPRRGRSRRPRGTRLPPMMFSCRNSSCRRKAQTRLDSKSRSKSKNKTRSSFTISQSAEWPLRRLTPYSVTLNYHPASRADIPNQPSLLLFFIFLLSFIIFQQNPDARVAKRSPSRFAQVNHPLQKRFPPS